MAIEDMLHAAYSSIRGREQSRATAPITLDHLLQQHIEAIRGGESRSLLSASGRREGGHKKVSKLVALDNIKSQVDKVASAVNSAGGDKTKLAALGLDDYGQGGPA
jgi:hypothetical protein